eukprot:COSAG02_NODE_3975_length_5965_cov_5.092226_9_plen_40_part_00
MWGGSMRRIRTWRAQAASDPQRIDEMQQGVRVKRRLATQ